MNRIRIFFSGRLVGLLCTLVSMLAINSIQQTTDNLGWDNSFSIAAAKNIAEHHGYSIRLASASDISKSYYEPLNKWPPGYSYLLVITQLISSLDWIQAAFLLNAIGLTLLVLLFRKMLLQLNYPFWIVHPAVLYFGFIFHYFLGIYFTDIFALLFFMTGCSLLLQYVKAEQKHLYLVILAAFFFAFSAWQKYLYFGLAFIPLLSCFFFAWKRKIKKLQLASVYGLFVTGFLIVLLVYLLFRNTGQAVYIKPSSRTGFFPLQLLGLSPIVPGTFLNLNFLNMQISEHVRISYQNMDILWSVINIFCLCFLVYISWPMIRRTDYFKKEYLNFYALMSFWVSLFVFIFLGTLTIRFNSHYEDMAYPWVFVGIPRYFAPFCILIFQFFVFLFLKPGLFPRKTSFYVFRILMVCIMLEEISHGTYFIVKQIFIKKEFGLRRPADRRELCSYRFVLAEMAKKTAVVVCAGTPEISNFSGLSGCSMIMDDSDFRKPMYSSKEVLIITTLDSFSALHMPPEFFKMDTRLVFRQAAYSYYFTRIHPDIFPNP
jgi:hypothetical protein